MKSSRKKSHANPNTLFFVATLAGISWAWAASCLAIKHHQVVGYHGIAAAPPFWGFFALDIWRLGLIVVAGVFIGIAAYQHSIRRRAAVPPATRWLMASGVIVGLDFLRFTGTQIPATILEPLFFAAVTGWATALILEDWRPLSKEQDSDARWTYVVWICALLCCVWWYFQAIHAYDNLMLSYHDWGHFARRVVNTWEGRGFLKETPNVHPFWDHFNPGLALIVPIWAIWPNAKLFILLQAICLSIPAPIVFGIAKRYGHSSAGATGWALAYLLYPSIGQWNLNFSYGWHPVSCALPFLFASIWLLLRGNKVAAAISMIVACSFKETVIVAVGCLAFAMAVQLWCDRRSDSARNSEDDASAIPVSLANQLSMWIWLSLWAVLVIIFLLVYNLTPFGQYQTGRFSDLGDSAFQVALSPVLRPGIFWPTIFRLDSVFFLLALLLPLGLRQILRGWPFLLAIALPMIALLAWQHQGSTSIAFQYTTSLVPFLFVAAIAGGAHETATRRSGYSALAACATISIFLGSMPWSSSTLDALVGVSYQDDNGRFTASEREVGTDGNRLIRDLIEQVDSSESRILASSRIAAHLLRVERLEAIGHARDRWDLLCENAGAEKSGIELFNWVLIDTNDRFQHSRKDMQFMIDEAKQAGYKTVCNKLGVVLLAKPMHD